MTDADSEDGKAGINDRGNFAGRVSAGGGGVAGAVRQEHTVGLHGEDVVRLGFGRHDGDVTSGVGQAAQDIVLAAEIHGDDPVRGIGGEMGCAEEVPASLVPRGFRVARHLDGEVHAGKPWPVACLCRQRVDIEDAVGVVANHSGGGACVSDTAGQGAGIDPGNAGKVMCHHPGLKRGIRCASWRVR